MCFPVASITIIIITAINKKQEQQSRSKATTYKWNRFQLKFKLQRMDKTERTRMKAIFPTPIPIKRFIPIRSICELFPSYHECEKIHVRTHCHFWLNYSSILFFPRNVEHGCIVDSMGIYARSDLHAPPFRFLHTLPCDDRENVFVCLFVRLFALFIDTNKHFSRL